MALALALALASKYHGLGLGLGLEPAGLEPIPAAILDFLGAYWYHPRRPLEGFYRCAKFC